MTATLTLPDGTTSTLTWARAPRHWKSALLRTLPYGTDTQGATYTLTR